MTDLDPFPWRTWTGTRGTYMEKYKDIIWFEPRPQYEQDVHKYYPENRTGEPEYEQAMKSYWGRRAEEI